MMPQGMPAARPTLAAEERPLETAADVEDGVEAFEEVEVREAELVGADGEGRMTLDIVTAAGRGEAVADIAGGAVDNAA
jgi:hypothetical protein